MGKDAKGIKGKGKTRAKSVKGGKCSAMFSTSLPPDSDEESCSQNSLALILIFKILARRVFERSGSSADAKLVEGVWPNQNPLSLSARFFARQNGAFSFFFGPVFFLFFTHRLFFYA